MTKGHLKEKGEISNSKTPSLLSNTQCLYFKKPGHLISDCCKLKNKNNPSSSNAFISSTTEAEIFYPDQPTVMPKTNTFDTSGDVIEDHYEPFITDGLVSLIGDTHLKPIKILWDTGASQSSILEDILSFSETFSIGVREFISSVQCGVCTVPLHHIHLQSELVMGSVTVTIQQFILVEGVSILLGNNLAGCKVIPGSHVIEDSSTEQLAEKFPTENDCIDLSEAMLLSPIEIFETCKSFTNDHKSFSTSLD